MTKECTYHPFISATVVKIIITLRISYQWVIQEVISSYTNTDLIRIALTKSNIFWKVLDTQLDTGKQ